MLRHFSFWLIAWASAVWSAHLGILLTLPWFEFLEMSTGIGSNSSPLPFSPHDMRKAESAVKVEGVKDGGGKEVKGSQRKEQKESRMQVG